MPADSAAHSRAPVPAPEPEPVSEEFERSPDCDRPGCPHVRYENSPRLSRGPGGRRPYVRAARRALALAAAASAVLTAPHIAAAAPPTGSAPTLTRSDDGDRGVLGGAGGSPQGGSGGLHGRPGRVLAAPAVSRAEILDRAASWVRARVPYSADSHYKDGYRQDCSGFVSMAWNLGRNEWTGSLTAVAEPVGRQQLQPGDILLFHNQADPGKGSHVTIFGGWTDSSRSHYLAYEQARPHTRRQITPYAYWTHSERYSAYRYKNLRPVAQGPAPSSARRFPGAAAFGPGARGPYVTQLGRMLVQRGGARFYRSGPSPVWGEADRRATRAFQRAQGWTGDAANGLPGPLTWEYLVTGRGRDIPDAGVDVRADVGAAPAYPGRGAFRPGRSNPYVERLGRQLVQKGFGRHYRQGPGPTWGEADRRNVEEFQRAQGWRGGAADGYPGPETWRRLFR
ncbi:peptidoglycan-binding protein [Streptomyces sp. Da 82-17]|uniref:peptidoglycan-binding protein n=1 Tax=Streptomyces sp. Da 82-17 TaxID=3377116 RepID=UPI0038D46B7F